MRPSKAWARLRLTNRSDKNRRLTATYDAEWLLGAMRSAAKPHVVTAYDAELTAIVARNGWNPEFGDRIAFVTASLEPHSLTGDRHDFLGKEGGVADPAGLRRWISEGAAFRVATPAPDTRCIWISAPGRPPKSSSHWDRPQILPRPAK